MPGERSVDAMTIAFDTDAFWVGQPSAPAAGHRHRWADVQAVVAYKRDVFAFDVICLALEFPGPTSIELNDQMQGWQPFIDSLPLYLDGLPPSDEWVPAVALPAFATNMRVLFRR
jgi:hypothetical protein